MTCLMCGRLLDNPEDPYSANCGGDCVRCMALAGDPDCMAEMRRMEPHEPRWEEERSVGMVFRDSE